MIRFRIPVPGTQGRVTRSRENANLARLIRRTGISQATYTVEQQAFTTTGGTGTKNLIQIALAIHPGWMDGTPPTWKYTVESRWCLAMRDITQLMNAYRECSRSLWNVYFAKREDVGGSLDAFEQIRELLFDSLVVSELPYEGDAKGHDVPPPTLKVVPRTRSLILIERPSGAGEAGYWDQEKDMVVGPDDITLAFADYFDFSQVPIKDLRYYRCKILSFPRHADYEGREALLEVSDATVFHDESADHKPKTT